MLEVLPISETVGWKKKIFKHHWLMKYCANVSFKNNYHNENECLTGTCMQPFLITKNESFCTLKVND